MLGTESLGNGVLPGHHGAPWHGADSPRGPGPGRQRGSGVGTAVAADGSGGRDRATRVLGAQGVCFDRCGDQRRGGDGGRHLVGPHASRCAADSRRRTGRCRADPDAGAVRAAPRHMDRRAVGRAVVVRRRRRPDSAGARRPAGRDAGVPRLPATAALPDHESAFRWRQGRALWTAAESGGAERRRRAAGRAGHGRRGRAGAGGDRQGRRPAGGGRWGRHSGRRR